MVPSTTSEANSRLILRISFLLFLRLRLRELSKFAKFGNWEIERTLVVY
jgi:hypothetical protein